MNKTYLMADREAHLEDAYKTLSWLMKRRD